MGMTSKRIGSQRGLCVSTQSTELRLGAAWTAFYGIITPAALREAIAIYRAIGGPVWVIECDAAEGYAPESVGAAIAHFTLVHQDLGLRAILASIGDGHVWMGAAAVRQRLLDGPIIEIVDHAAELPAALEQLRERLRCDG